VNDITYGIKIEKTSNRGVAAIFKSSDMEIDHLEITNIGGVGIGLKTQAVCSDGSTDDWQAYDYYCDGRLGNDLDDVVNRANFVQFNTVVHDNYIHNVGSEGIYAGSSFYQGQEFDCDSGTEIIYDPLLIGVSIYNNIVDGSGLDGIQAGSAVEDCGIHHNRIYRDSLRDANNEQSGIMNNKGSACHIYNNYIQDGGGPGIFLQGIGGHRVYNNILINVGANFAGEDKGGNGIFISQNGVGSGQDMYVFNNTIVNPQHYGIVFNDDDSAASKIQNNIVINPGNLSDYGDDAYIQIWKRKNVIVSNNLHAENPSDLKFSSPANFDYTLTENSAAIDSGVNLISDCVFTDYNDERRPQGKGFDIGAYEYQDRASGEMSELTTVDVQPRLFLPLLIADIQSACP
jgi:hypothetical protein